MRFFITTFICFSMAVWSASAQEVTVINQYPDSSAHLHPEDYFIKKSTRHVLVINYYEPASEDQSARLKELVGGALSFYLDQCIALNEGEIELLKDKNTILKEMEQIVSDAGKYYQFKMNDSFTGFSEEVRKMVHEIDGSQWENSEFYTAGLSARKKKNLTYAFYQEELNAIKRRVNREVGNMQQERLMVMSGTSTTSVDEEDLKAEIDSFRKNDPLEPIEMDFSDATVTLLAADDEWALADKSEMDKNKTSSGESDFAEKVFRLLEQNDKKLDRLQEEIDQLKISRSMETETDQPTREEDLQLQIDQLRNLIVKVLNNERPEGEEIKKVATYNLPRAVDINFGLGSKNLDLTAKYKLNEIIELLGYNPTFKLIITGYADKTGNSAANMALSQERARKVKSFIAESGISPSRLIVNFFGDQSSTSANPDDRKVVLEFVPL